jgi:hypothetical protein
VAAPAGIAARRNRTARRFMCGSERSSVPDVISGNRRRGPAAAA